MTELRRSFVSADDSPSLDAFGRWRVSNPSTLFDSKQISDNAPLIFDDQQVSGSGTTSTHSTATASTTMGVAASTAGRRIRQTFMRFNYQPGKSLELLLTGVLSNTGGGTGITRGFGYYDDNNGIFLREQNGIVQIVKRTSTSGSPVDFAIDQADWNVDKLDGTGVSGINLNKTKSQVLIIDLEWLGVGRVRVGFVIGGCVHYAHEFLHSNSLNTVYMSTPNLPIRYEIQNDGTGGAATLQHICSTVVSEGGQDKNGVLRHVKGPLMAGLTAGTNYIAQALRLKTAYLATTIDILTTSIIATTSNDDAHWYLAVGGTPSAALTYNNLTNSSMQYAQGNGTITLSGGTILDGGFVSVTNTFRQDIINSVRMGSTIAGVAQIFYLVVTPITSNTTIQTAVTWRELI